MGSVNAEYVEMLKYLSLQESTDTSNDAMLNQSMLQL